MSQPGAGLRGASGVEGDAALGNEYITNLVSSLHSCTAHSGRILQMLQDDPENANLIESCDQLTSAIKSAFTMAQRAHRGNGDGLAGLASAAASAAPRKRDACDAGLGDDAGVEGQVALPACLWHETEMQIFVKTLSGRSVYLLVKPSATIESLKTMVQDKQGIPHCMQRFMFDGETLDDERTLSGCHIRHLSTLHLVHRMRIFVHTLSGHKIPLWVEPSDSIESIKAAVQDKEGTHKDHQKLIYKGSEIKSFEVEDCRTVSEYDIEHMSHVYMSPFGGPNMAPFGGPNQTRRYGPVVERMQIIVKTRSGEYILVEAEPSDWVSSVKLKIQDKEGYRPDLQRLLFDGKPLDDGKTLLECQLGKNSTVELELLMHVFVMNRRSGRLTTLAVDPSDSIGTVKAKLYSVEGISPEMEQNLKFRCGAGSKQFEWLEDGRTLAEYRIQKHTTLHLDVRPVQIFYKNLDRKIKTLDVKPSDSGKSLTPMFSHTSHPRFPMYHRHLNLLFAVETMRAMMSDKEGVPVDSLRLLYAGRQLEDGCTLSDCKIKKESTVYLVLRWSGGRK